jgi:hypothetical protein
LLKPTAAPIWLCNSNFLHSIIPSFQVLKNHIVAVLSLRLFSWSFFDKHTGLFKVQFGPFSGNLLTTASIMITYTLAWFLLRRVIGMA